ncbi:recombinase family protein [Streptomyces sp. NBC_01571]|uniref:recombinase family protein n=1 Tax=Streptomyces sp. NBC_01571 TaxID=2975883 RepID=UPI00338EA395
MRVSYPCGEGGAFGGVDGEAVAGFTAEGSSGVEQPAEQVGLARARELQAAGASLREICRRLEAEQLPPRGSDRWYPEAVRRMLRHEAPYTLRPRTT